MQRIILSGKNTIMVLGGALILMAFAGEWLGAGEGLSHGTLLAASILGVLPIAIQAWQALRGGEATFAAEKAASTRPRRAGR